MQMPGSKMSGMPQVGHQGTVVTEADSTETSDFAAEQKKYLAALDSQSKILNIPLLQEQE